MEKHLFLFDVRGVHDNFCQDCSMLSMCEINNNGILNERQVHQNSEQRFTLTLSESLETSHVHGSRNPGRKLHSVFL